MIITFVGEPDVGKFPLAQAIMKSRDDVSISRGIPATPVGAALGPMADYRTEVFLASYRAHSARGDKPVIHTTSLLNSLGYISMRLAAMVGRQSVPDDEVERWMLALSMTTVMVRDSFESDLVFYLPPADATMNSFTSAVGTFLVDVLDDLGQEYVTLDGSVTENAVLVSKMVTDAQATATY